MIKFKDTIVMQSSNNDDVMIIRDGVCYEMPIGEFEEMLTDFITEHPLKKLEEIIKFKCSGR